MTKNDRRKRSSDIIIEVQKDRQGSSKYLKEQLKNFFKIGFKENLNLDNYFVKKKKF